MKKKIIIYIVILFILAAGGCATYAVLFTDLFKSDKEMFLTYLGKNISNLEVFSDDDLENYLEKQNKTPYKNEGKFKIKANDEDSQNISISFNGDVDKKENYNYQQIKLKYSNDVSAEIDFLKDENNIGITIPEVIKKYLILDTNNVQKLADKLGVENAEEMPDKINLRTNIKINKDIENFKLKDSYKEILINSINEENITKTKTDIYTKYSYKTTIAKLKDTTKQVLVAIKNDEDSLNELAEQYKENYEVSDNEAEEYKEELKETIQFIIDELDKENENDDEIIEIAVYAQGKSLMKTEILDEENIITFQFSQDGIELRAEEKDDEQLKTVIDLNIKKVKKSDELSYEIEALAENITIKATIDFSDLSDVENVEEKYSLSFDNVEFNYESTKKFVDSIEKKELTEKQKYVLNNKTSEQLTNMAQQLLMSVYQLHMNKMQEAGILEDPITSLIEGSSRLENDEHNNEDNQEENNDNQENNIEDASRTEDDDENEQEITNNEF